MESTERNAPVLEESRRHTCALTPLTRTRRRGARRAELCAGKSARLSGDLAVLPERSARRYDEPEALTWSQLDIAKYGAPLHPHAHPARGLGRWSRVRMGQPGWLRSNRAPHRPRNSASQPSGSNRRRKTACCPNASRRAAFRGNGRRRKAPGPLRCRQPDRPDRSPRPRASSPPKRPPVWTATA